MVNAKRERPLVLQWRTAVLNSSESPSTKLTLLAIAEHASPEGRDCYPGIDTLARQTSLGEKTCRLALNSADGRWFTRTPMKFAGRDWRGYSYQLRLPDGAVTVTGPRREVAVTVTGPHDASSGHSGREVRSLTPRAAVMVTDDLGKAPRKSTKGDKRKRAPEVTMREWLKQCQDDEDRAIPPGDPIFEFAAKAGISEDFLYLAWRWFLHRFRDDDDRRYRDWRAVFRRAVKEDWHHCWRKDFNTGEMVLTNAGLQLQNEIEAST